MVETLTSYLQRGEYVTIYTLPTSTEIRPLILETDHLAIDRYHKVLHNHKPTMAPQLAWIGLGNMGRVRNVPCLAIVDLTTL